LQSVSIEWSAPAVAGVPGYVVSAYKLLVTIDGTDQAPISVSNLFHQYDIPEEYLPPATAQAANFAFKIQAEFSSEFTTQSASQTIRTYAIAGQPSNPVVQWASTTLDNKVDILLSFGHPTDVGLSDTLESTGVYTLVVYDEDETEMNRTTRSYSSAMNGSYNIFFNNVATTPTGRIELYLTTKDNASGSNFRFDGTSIYVNYTAYEIPQFVNDPSWDSTAITCSIVTQTLLGKYGVIAVHGEGVTHTQFSTVAGTNGATVSYNVNEDEESYLYTIVFPASFFPESVVPDHVDVAVSNGMGIGRHGFIHD